MQKCRYRKTLVVGINPILEKRIAWRGSLRADTLLASES
jgi:hypothetical protein